MRKLWDLGRRQRKDGRIKVRNHGGITQEEISESPSGFAHSKILFLVISFMVFICFAGCDRKVGNVRIEKRGIPVSQIFTEEEIDEAMDAVIQEFELNFANCTLTDIWYVGDESNAALLWEEDKRTSETRKMFIYTNFNINSSTGVYATCNNWKWIVSYGRVWRIPGDWHV